MGLLLNNKNYFLKDVRSLILSALIMISIMIQVNIIFAASVEKEIEILAPGDIAINNNDGNVYVLSSDVIRDIGEIIILDEKLNNIIGSILLNFSQPITIGDYNTTGGLPVSISHNLNTNQFYVTVNSIYVNNTNPNDGRWCGDVRENLRLVCNILVIDGDTNKVVDIINTDQYDLQKLSIDEINNKIFVVNGNFLRASIHDLGNISVIDGQTTKIIDTIAVGDNPSGIAFDKNNNRLYVANQLSNSISIIDLKANKVVTLPVDGGRPVDILFNLFNNHIYFADGFKNEVSVIDNQTNKIIDTIAVGDIPNELSLNLQNGDVYVTIGFKNEVSVIDGQTNKIIDTIAVGNNPVNIAFNNINNKLYVSNSMDNTVSIINMRE